MRTILLPMTEPKGQEGALDLAFGVARKFNSHLTALFIRPDPRAAIPFMGEGLTADAIQDLVDASEREGKARAARTHAVFEAWRQRADVELGDGLEDRDRVTASFEETTGFIADRVGRAARLADLTIVPQPVEPNSADASELLSEVLFRSGRPLMMAPPTASSVIGENIVLAWNGRAECARTAAAALPFLRLANSVRLLTVGEEHPERPGLEGLSVYLARHGIEADILRRPDDGATGEIILDVVENCGADLLVMGAFSHSRWREMIIGGVTRHAIQHAKIPVFMSH
ncbi:MAG: universal stress protein [Rhodothalassiaceae bacterium]